MILVPLFDLKFLHEFAATSAGTSNRRHLCQRKESRADISSARDLHDARDRAMREHPPLMQHDDLVVLRNFVDEMRGPQHGDTLSNHFVHVAEDSGS